MVVNNYVYNSTEPFSIFIKGKDGKQAEKKSENAQNWHFLYYVIARWMQKKKATFKNLLCEVVVHTVAISCAKYHLKITFLY